MYLCTENDEPQDLERWIWARQGPSRQVRRDQGVDSCHVATRPRYTAVRDKGMIDQKSKQDRKEREGKKSRKKQ